MELKYCKDERSALRSEYSNRTFMELKSKNFTFSELHGEILIVPLWN